MLPPRGHTSSPADALRHGSGPVGLCLLISDPEVMRRRPEAVWPGVGMMYAGYLEDGRQVRIGYFEGARI